MPRVEVSYSELSRYPGVQEHSPSVAYPEYPFAATERSRENHVYHLVRRCLHEYGCDPDRYDTPGWNPLGRWISRGARVFVLPNLVMHRRRVETLRRFHAKCTHSSVLRAVLDYAMIATGDAGLISFGNAPLQSCDYQSVASESGAQSVGEFYRRNTGRQVGPKDLRLLRSRWTSFGAMVALERDGLEDAVAFDLGKDSLLEALYTSSADVRFRVGDYEPGETMSHHGPGKHVYLVNRRMLEADVIISVPKLKTHQKVGITCALKGTVGAIARKECLAHHRKGSPQEGGDEYPRAGTVSDLCSNMLERSCTLGTDPLSNAYRISSRLLGRLVRSTPRGITLGSWHGNDTAWRMTLDIARILMFGRLDGSLSPVPIRRHLALVDGVLGGEKEGPLTPLPRPTGVVLFGDDICAVDWACCFVMGFDPQKIPLLRNSLSISRFPLSAARSHEIEVCLNGEAAPLNSLAKAFSPQFRPPKGWVGKIELAGSWGAGSSEILGHDGRAAAL